MATETNLHNLYKQHILPVQRKYDGLRKRIAFNYIFIGFFIFAAFMFEAITWMLIGIIVTMVFTFFYVRWFWIDRDRFDRDYRKAMSDAALQAIFTNSSSDFDDKAYLDLNTLRRSLLISREPSSFDGDGLFSVQHAEYSLRFSEVTAASKSMDKMGQSVSSTILTGIFFEAIPTGEELLAEGGFNLKSTHGWSDLIPHKLWENRGWKILPEQQTYELHGNEFIQFDGIFSEPLIQAIQKLSREYDSGIRITLHNSTLYGFIAREESALQTKVFSSLVKPKTGMQFLEELRTIRLITEHIAGRKRVYSTA